MNQTDIKELKDRLHFLRVKHCGVRSKKKFADALGLPMSTYSSYEAGRTPPSSFLVKVADITGCDINWLITGSAAKTPAKNPDPGISDILARMESILSNQPKAKNAVSALLDLLSAGSINSQPIAKKEVKEKIIPLIAKAAAGIPAFWSKADARTQSVLDSAISPSDRQHLIPISVTDIVPEHFGQIPPKTIYLLLLSQPVELHGISVAAFLVSADLPARGLLLAFQIDGDSMEELFRQGDIVIADTGQSPKPGEPAIIDIEGGVGPMCKLYFPTKESVRLTSANRDFDSLEIHPKKIRNAFRLIGKVNIK
jgi:phage repressor protein C with HTH and peptisase S24 domain